MAGAALSYIDLSNWAPASAGEARKELRYGTTGSSIKLASAGAWNTRIVAFT